MGNPVTPGISGSAMAILMRQISLPAATSKTARLDELAQSGEFLPALTSTENLTFAVLCGKVRSADGTPSPTTPRYVFARSEGSAGVFLNTVPRPKLKGNATVTVYDPDNRIVMQSSNARRNKGG